MTVGVVEIDAARATEEVVAPVIAGVVMIVAERDPSRAQAVGDAFEASSVDAESDV